MGFSASECRRPRRRAAAIACLVALAALASTAVRGADDEELLGYAMEGEAEEVSRLLAGGASPNAADEEGETALMYGAASGNAQVVRLLLEAGADPNRRNEAGQTALMSAVIADGETDVEEMYPLFEEVARALIEGGADTTLQDAQGRTALDVARRYGLAHMVALLE